MKRSLAALILLSWAGTAHAGVTVHVGAGGSGRTSSFSGSSHYVSHGCYSGRSFPSRPGYYSYGLGSGYGYAVGAIGYDDFDSDFSTPYYPATPTPVYPSAVNPASSLPVYPAVAVTPSASPSSSSVAPAVSAPKQPLNQIPYGFDLGTKLVKSPWSGFVFNGAAKAPDQVVYDANTGQAFRIPPLQ
jgi:hypothetical protein